MRAFTPLRPVLVSAAILAAAGCAGAGRAPAPAPTPATPGGPATPGRDEPATRPVEAVPPRGPSVAFGYASGTRRYAVTTTATVEVAAPGAPVESDSLVTRTYITYVLGGGGTGQTVGGAIDSVFVTSRRLPAASQAVTTAVPFSGTLTTSGVQLAPEPGDPARCAAGAPDALLGVARELLVALPPSIGEGAAWRDSSVTTTCRGNVPITARTVHEYRVARVADDTSGRTAIVERTSRTAIAGEGSGGSSGTTITGTAAAEGRFTLDLAAGSYQSGEITSTTDLTATVDGRPQRLTQRGVTRVVLVGAP
jgi:hypothetical protein